MEHIGAVLGTGCQGYPKTRNTNSRTNIEAKRPKRSRAELLRDLGLGEPLRTFANFQLLSGTGKAYEAIRQFTDGKTEATMLLCYGGLGSGKTHLLQAAILRLYGRGIFTRYLTWSRVISTLKAGLNDGAMPPYRQILSNYFYARALVIDDIGMGSTGTEWEWSQLEEIVNVRYERQLLTLMATNKHLNELPDRVVSRFHDPDIGLIVLNSGNDYRKRSS